MSFTPPPPPNTRPRSEAGSPRDAGAVAVEATWLAHVEALRRARLAAEDAGAARMRAIVLANERLMAGRQRTIPD